MSNRSGESEIWAAYPHAFNAVQVMGLWLSSPVSRAGLRTVRFIAFHGDTRRYALQFLSCPQGGGQAYDI